MCENNSSRACSKLVGIAYFRGSPRFLAMQKGSFRLVPVKIAPQDNWLCGIMPQRGRGFPRREDVMTDEVYGPERAQRLVALLRALAERIQELDRTGRLLDASPELQKLLGNARSELFHYEVRSTYDTPEIAESRRIVEDALREPSLEDPDDEEPWKRNQQT